MQYSSGLLEPGEASGTCPCDTSGEKVAVFISDNDIDFPLS